MSAILDSSKSVCAPKSIWDPSGPVCYLPGTFPFSLGTDDSDNASSLSAPHTCDILMAEKPIQLTGATAAGGADAEVVQDAEDLSAFEVSPLVASHIGTGTHASALHTSTHNCHNNPRPCIPSLRVPALSPPSRIISPCLRPPFSKRPDLTFSCRKVTSEDLDLDISLSTNSFFSPSSCTSAQVSPSSSWTNDDPENTGQRSNDKRYTYMYTPSAVRHPNWTDSCDEMQTDCHTDSKQSEVILGWLREMGVQRDVATEMIRQQVLTFGVLATIPDARLRELGVTKMGTRVKLKRRAQAACSTSVCQRVQRGAGQASVCNPRSLLFPLLIVAAQHWGETGAQHTRGRATQSQGEELEGLELMPTHPEGLNESLNSGLEEEEAQLCFLGSGGGKQRVDVGALLHQMHAGRAEAHARCAAAQEELNAWESLLGLPDSSQVLLLMAALQRVQDLRDSPLAQGLA